MKKIKVFEGFAGYGGASFGLKRSQNGGMNSRHGSSKLFRRKEVEF